MRLPQVRGVCLGWVVGHPRGATSAEAAWFSVPLLNCSFPVDEDSVV